MLTTLAATALIVIANHPSFPVQIIIRHETGHAVCPNWKHGAHDMSAVTPPKECRGAFKGKLIITRMPNAEVRAVCKADTDACLVDLW